MLVLLQESSSPQASLSVARLQSYYPSSLLSYSESYPASTQSIPKDGIGPRHHPHEAICGCIKVKTMPRKRLWFPMQAFITSHQFTFRRGQLRLSGLPVNHLPLQQLPKFGAGTPSPRTSTAIRAGKWTRGR